jgi:very-short-patch-repair endonuclease
MKSEKWYAAMNARKGKGTNQFTKAKQLGLENPEISLETREKHRKTKLGKKHTEETKKKISESRIEFLRLNPDKVPYKLNHYSHGRSYPEEYWKGILDSFCINYTEQYQIGPYQLDFAIVTETSKIDLEIDGNQHYLDPRIVESDKRRNKYLEELEWKIIRINWAEYKRLDDKKTYIDFIISQL